jgi:APA family basic amino acid/polyamine antiporter
LVNVIVIMLRVKRPNDSRPFRIPGDIGKVPLLPIFGIGVTLLMASQLDLRSVLLAAVLTAAGPVLYVAGRRLSSS